MKPNLIHFICGSRVNIDLLFTGIPDNATEDDVELG